MIVADEMGHTVEIQWIKNDMVKIFTFTLSNSFCHKHPRVYNVLTENSNTFSLKV